MCVYTEQPPHSHFSRPFPSISPVNFSPSSSRSSASPSPAQSISPSRSPPSSRRLSSSAASSISPVRPLIRPCNNFINTNQFCPPRRHSSLLSRNNIPKPAPIKTTFQNNRTRHQSIVVPQSRLSDNSQHRRPLSPTTDNNNYHYYYTQSPTHFAPSPAHQTLVVPRRRSSLSSPPLTMTPRDRAKALLAERDRLARHNARSSPSSSTNQSRASSRVRSDSDNSPPQKHVSLSIPGSPVSDEVTESRPARIASAPAPSTASSEAALLFLNILRQNEAISNRNKSPVTTSPQSTASSTANSAYVTRPGDTTPNSRPTGSSGSPSGGQKAMNTIPKRHRSEMPSPVSGRPVIPYGDHRTPRSRADEWTGNVPGQYRTAVDGWEFQPERLKERFSTREIPPRF